MTNKTFTADINQNIALSWTTSLTDFFNVRPPRSSDVIYQVQGGSIISNFEDRKYIFDKMTQDVKAINITVIRVNMTDAGLYSAETGGNVDGCCLLIVTTKPIKPTVTIQPEHPFVGDNIIFTCNSMVQRWPGNLPSHLSYQFIGNTRGESNNNRLTMNTITKMDKGTIISCQATDDLGKTSIMSNTVTLDPYYGPENVVVEPAIANINVTEGTALGPIYCIATCIPGCKYKWKQSWTGKFKPVSSKYISTQNRSVKVSAIKRSQTGTYRCRVDHSTGYKYKTKDISVNVQYSPKITAIWFSSNNQRYGVRTPTTFNFNEKVNVKTTLRVESNPDPQIMFKSSLLKIQQINKGNGYIDFTSNLPSLKCEDSGNFSIQASNRIPYADTRMVNFKISCKPRNATPESRTIGAKINTVKHIVLHVTSFPAPTVTWVRRSSFTWKIQKDRYDYRHKIHSKICIRSEVDFGVYGFNICNRLGCIVENITLKPQDKPEAPQNFSVETTTFRSVNISWIAGFNGGHEQTFSVQYKATDNVKWDTKTVHTNDIKTGSTVYYTLDQLRPDTSYQVIVVSKNIQGQRNASLEFKTKVEPTVKSPLKTASMTPVLIGFGCGIAVILIIVTSLYVFCSRRNRGSTSESTESNVLYAAVDKIQQKIKRRNPENENQDSNEPANAEYASVVKPKSKSKKVHYKEIYYTENDNVYPNQGDADLLIHQPLKTKPSGRSKNKDGLTYIEVSFTRKPKGRRRIIGAENRTDYVDIDFTRKADPLPESSDE
ncbi:neural cell adhesion molecule 1-like isoform X2 [Mytilus californianus]|uniref:neural cell adhesion molecule 1-like isoform X2 n=1 Tax=Mytilus californianus TaxID=6549 RepID=UPI00224508EE|nr:neural cell adhesion molecule 1-like isoform X2 [Mytilus californianus]